MVEAHEIEPTVWTKENVIEFARKVAKEYDIDPDFFVKVMACEVLKYKDENGEIQWDVKGQSQHFRNGKQEESYGVFQFNLPSKNKTETGEIITKEMAQNPAIAVPAAAWHFSEGRAYSMWTCANLVASG